MRIISGGQTGIDTLGLEVAKELGVEFEADYKKLPGRVQIATVAASTVSHFEISKYLYYILDFQYFLNF